MTSKEIRKMSHSLTSFDLTLIDCATPIIILLSEIAAQLAELNESRQIPKFEIVTDFDKISPKFPEK